MGGFKKLSPEIKNEMRKDAKNAMRGLAFRTAREKADQCDLDEYIRFLSEAMEMVKSEPTKRLTHDFRL